MSEHDRDIVNLNRLAKDVIAEDRAGDLPVHYAHPHHRQMVLPEYVRHHEGVGHLGALAAEAVVHQYETAARAIEAMGKEMIKVVEHCDQVSANALKAMKECEKTALGYREEARKAFENIQHNALLVQHVAETCDELQRKIAATAEAVA